MNSAMSRNLEIDLAIPKALSVSPSACSIESYGGARFAKSFKVTVVANGTKTHYFLKTSPDGEMMKGEHTSLSAIHAAVPSLCPGSIAHGQLSHSPDYYLLTEFLDTKIRNPGGAVVLDLPRKLAKLHSTPAPIPESHTGPMFGFPVTTFCGDTAQNNSYRSSWADFFAENRLRNICTQIEVKHGKSNNLKNLVEKTIAQVVPRLLGDGHLRGELGIVPVVVHGDLWSGNKATGRVGGEGGAQEYIFDASSCYAHSEYELGIMKLFGGFPTIFFDEYHRLIPKTEPKEEYHDRVSLYQLYHYLNHTVLFGIGGYADSAIKIMRRLCGKYCDKNENDL